MRKTLSALFVGLFFTVALGLAACGSEEDPDNGAKGQDGQNNQSQANNPNGEDDDPSSSNNESNNGGSGNPDAVSNSDDAEQTGGEDGTDDDSNDGVISSDEARIHVEMTDAPAEFEKVPITVCSVQIGGSGQDSEDDMDGNQAVPPDFVNHGDTSDASESSSDVSDASSDLASGHGGGPEDAGSTDTGGGPPADVGGGQGLDGTCGVGDNPDWETLVDQTQSFDLLELQNDVTRALGGNTIPAGNYSQIRLILSDANVVVDGTEKDLFVPSGAQTGFKLNHDFEVPGGSQCNLRLDFDAKESIKKTGRGYLLTPVLKVEEFACESVSEGDAGTTTGDTSEPDGGSMTPDATDPDAGEDDPDTSGDASSDPPAPDTAEQDPDVSSEDTTE